MAHAPGRYPFYDELAPWWPLISPPDEYEEEAAFAATVLRSASIPVRHVLELGSGGGHNASHLKAHFAMTLTDLSESMLTVSRELNPECQHQQGDMRSLRIGREFDAIFVHDAVDYMATEDDLRRAIATAFVHCRPGGIALFEPDSIRETFEAGADHGGHDGADGRSVRYLEWSWDPDPTDTWTQTDYTFLLRDARRRGTASRTRATAWGCSAATIGCASSLTRAFRPAPSPKSPRRIARLASCSSATGPPDDRRPHVQRRWRSSA